MNLKTTSYAPLCILVAFLASLVDYFLLGGFHNLSLLALVVGVLSVLYLLGRAAKNLASDIRADRAAAAKRMEADRQAREQLRARIVASADLTPDDLADQMRRRLPDAQ